MKMKLKLKHSTKLILVFIPMSILLLLLGYQIFETWTSDYILENFVKEKTNYVSDIATIIREELVNKDVRRISRRIEGTKFFREAIYVNLCLEDGDNVARFNIKGDLKDFPCTKATGTYFNKTKDILFIEIPTYFGQNTKTFATSIFCGFPFAQYEYLYSKIKLILFVVLCIIALVMSIFIFGHSRQLVRPIESLFLKFTSIINGEDEKPGDKAYEVLSEYMPLVSKFKEIVESLNKFKDRVKRTERYVTIGTMSAELAHGLKAPSAGLKMLVAKLKERISPSDPIYEHMELIESETIKINRYVTNLSKYAKDVKITKRITDRDHILAYFTDTSRDISIMHTGIHLTLNSYLKNNTYSLDIEAINIILSNLLSNAMAAINYKGEISIELSDYNNGIQIAVKDSGIGIKKEDLPEIFEPYFTKGKPDGSGMGLSICKKYVDFMEGSINIVSQENRGTTVTVHV